MAGTTGSATDSRAGRLPRRAGPARWLVGLTLLGLLLALMPLQSALAEVTAGDRPVFVAVGPTRIADTRFNVGITGKLSSGAPKLLQVTGSVPIAPSGSATVVPAGASSVALNVTAVGPTRDGFVSVRPGTATGTPTTSNLNFPAGATVPNAVTVVLPIGGPTDGEIQIYFRGSGNSGTVDIIVDVVGYFDHHEHDDRYFRKNQTYDRAQTEDLVFDHRPIVGSISGATGSKRDTGPYSSSRSATGIYFASFDVTGLGIHSSQMPPNVTASASWLCPAGSIAQADWNGFVSLGDQVTSFSIQIRTFNSAGAAADCSTQFHVDFAAPSSLEIPLPTAADPAVPSRSGEPIECRNEPEGPVCGPVS